MSRYALIVNDQLDPRRFQTMQQAGDAVPLDLLDDGADIEIVDLHYVGHWCAWRVTRTPDSGLAGITLTPIDHYA